MVVADSYFLAADSRLLLIHIFVLHSYFLVADSFYTILVPDLRIASIDVSKKFHQGHWHGCGVLSQTQHCRTLDLVDAKFAQKPTTTHSSYNKPFPLQGGVRQRGVLTPCILGLGAGDGYGVVARQPGGPLDCLCRKWAAVDYRFPSFR